MRALAGLVALAAGVALASLLVWVASSVTTWLASQPGMDTNAWLQLGAAVVLVGIVPIIWLLERRDG